MSAVRVDITEYATASTDLASTIELLDQMCGAAVEPMRGRGTCARGSLP